MKSTPARVAGSILTKSMRVRTLSLSRTKSFLHICIRGRVGLSSTMSHEGVGFKPQSLRRRGFEPHRMHLIHLTDWRTGGASDSSPYRLWCVAAMAWRRWRGGDGVAAMLSCPRRDRVAPSSERKLMMRIIAYRNQRSAAPTVHAQVLPLHGQDRLARRQARRLRLRDQGHGRRQEDRGRRLGVRRHLQAGRHRRLRPALSVVERATRTD